MARAAAFPWYLRLRYGALAALAGWLSGWLATFPFELSTALRYVDGHLRQLPFALAEGMLVWAAFSLFMAVAGFLPVVLPLVLFVPPRWTVRHRIGLVLLAGLGAVLAMDARMHVLSLYYLHHRVVLQDIFFSAANFFVVTFAVVVAWVYSALVKRHLRSEGV